MTCRNCIVSYRLDLILLMLSMVFLVGIFIGLTPDCYGHKCHTFMRGKMSYDDVNCYDRPALPFCQGAGCDKCLDPVNWDCYEVDIQATCETVSAASVICMALYFLSALSGILVYHFRRLWIMDTIQQREVQLLATQPSESNKV